MSGMPVRPGASDPLATQARGGIDRDAGSACDGKAATGG